MAAMMDRCVTIVGNCVLVQHRSGASSFDLLEQNYNQQTFISKCSYQGL